ncbi:salicylate carboxymethyltransferase isoform X1 [Sesamum indicum]|uniref:Salicylate carboxymethyltransferase isoform X1 n=1 Tax=Sesamum indicum TaxID=4182 RepID=A0A6I9UG89_SESIN|nr:salicylate carboxymethyltransferase isoform X1 [Sesamum indicum]
MEVTQILHMNGGLGETSYANNSLIARKVISMSTQMIEESVTELYKSMVPKTMCIADLGSSAGPNTLFAASEVVRTVGKLRQKLEHRAALDFQIYLNDLPGNDFNSLFRVFLPRFQSELRREMPPGSGQCFVYGAPGSFYGRLFAAKSLHFVHSSTSLMWLSKVPAGVGLNKENICVSSTSPKTVINAYYKQFQGDFSTFLRCRSEEVVGGGRMVLSMLGRKSEEASSQDGCYIWELLAMAIKEMVSQGLIEENKLHTFHIPYFTPSPAEVAAEVEKEGSFALNAVEVSEISWAACSNSPLHSENAWHMASCLRSVAEPLLVEQFGEVLIDELFENYRKILSHRMSVEDNKFVNVSVSMTRRD